MTLVEFIDSQPLEHIAACLSLNPDTLVLIGREAFLKKADGIEKIIKRRLPSTKIKKIPITTFDIKEVTEILSNLANGDNHISFELTGGDEIALTAVGAIFERYNEKTKIELYKTDISKEELTECITGKKRYIKPVPHLSPNEIVLLHGGKIRNFSENCPSGAYGWNITPEFVSDIEKLWEICRENTKHWNRQLTSLSILGEKFSEKSTIIVPKGEINPDFDENLFKSLAKLGVIEFSVSGSRIKIAFKNEQIKRCLAKAGTILELTVMISALNQTYDSNPPARYYDNAVCGAFIDWDGIYSQPDTQNEIDVILTYGFIPVFISCKNGNTEEDELYKLSTVAERFGGKHAKKVLIASNRCNPYLTRRAFDMNIKLIDNFRYETIKSADKIMKSLIK